ncbi:methyl-accepting chemotaxis protein [Glaciecola sp. XM2]|jgi:methyl-accepting chemotaxis protein|uniref:methyl-accepting chemotaxis protein n=1 Tax=Glaciecola sp. XM2 TaxID=1914931 RepID=UPI001BDF67C7|nr:methyl-accepting chemotaxis protein [Glaciecola sp. XM2]MBT1451927.1 methyl-accepting chemotaxis protein [Glaciecola sp. XM2]
MQLTVVRKMVIGFTVLALLLLFTSFLSYLGLNDIKHSAEQVAQEKMPIQRVVSSLNVDILRLGTITTNTYFETDRQQLTAFKAQFGDSYAQYAEQLMLLSELVTQQNQALVDAVKLNSQAYLDASDAMFAVKFSILDTNQKLMDSTSAALMHADEASALMLDLSYLEGDEANLDAMIGTSTNIDNRIGLLLSNIKDLSTTTEPENAELSIGDLEYNISNIEVDVDYAKRLGEGIDDQGIFDMFDEEFASMKGALVGEAGVFGLKRAQLALIQQASEHRATSVREINQAIIELSNLSKITNDAALEGQQDILDAVSANSIQNIAISIVGIIATIALAVIATRSIAKPLAYVNQKLTILSSGDLTQQLKEDGNDEFSALAKSVNQLIKSLRSLIGSIGEREQSLREVMMKSVEMGDSSLAHVAQQQDQIHTTSGNTQQVKATSQSNLSKIHAADGQIDVAIKQSETVVALVEESKRQVTEQSEQAALSAEIVNRVGENSHKIGGILDVIKTIAEQTNLLALNAAIEAARAGEQGRGFAVVADEVRTLATRTQDSTEEIEKMIVSLQRDAQLAVDAMKTGSEQVQKGVEITDEVTSQVLTIKTLIQSLADFNQQIVQDTGQQDTLLDDVVTRLTTIVQLSENSAKSTQASNDAIHEIEVQMDGLSAAVKQFRMA